VPARPELEEQPEAARFLPEEEFPQLPGEAEAAVLPVAAAKLPEAAELLAEAEAKLPEAGELPVEEVAKLPEAEELPVAVAGKLPMEAVEPPVPGQAAVALPGTVLPAVPEPAAQFQAAQSTVYQVHGQCCRE